MISVIWPAKSVHGSFDVINYETERKWLKLFRGG